LTNLNID